MIENYNSAIERLKGSSNNEERLTHLNRSESYVKWTREKFMSM